MSQTTFGVLLSLLLVGSLAHPEAAAAQNPDLLLSVYFADEVDICPPQGYASMDDGVPSRCDPLSFDDLEKLVDDELALRVEDRVPPEEIRLGRLFDLIEGYQRLCSLSAPCLDATERRVVILAVEMPSPAAEVAGLPIEVARVPPRNSPIPGYSRSGALSPQGRWINHQRADVFLPAYNVRWRVTIGTWTWELQTTPGAG